MTSTYIILGMVATSLLLLILFFYFYFQVYRRENIHISKRDVDRITKSVNKNRETGGTIDHKPSKDNAKVTLEKTGKEYGGRPGIMIRQEADDEAVWHSHPRYDHPYVDTRNEVPSPEDISIMIRSGNSADVLVTPSGKIKRYGITPSTTEKLRLRERIDPTGYLLTRRLRSDMNKIEKSNPKMTRKDANDINKEWGRKLKVNYGIDLKTVPKTKSGVTLKKMSIKEE